MPVKENFFYATMIENDGKLTKEPTFAGCVLLIVAVVAVSFVAAYFFLVIVPVAFQ
jgi:hypothetical protein